MYLILNHFITFLFQLVAKNVFVQFRFEYQVTLYVSHIRGCDITMSHDMICQPFCIILLQ